jgi:hypothetical protein
MSSQALPSPVALHLLPTIYQILYLKYYPILVLCTLAHHTFNFRRPYILENKLPTRMLHMYPSKTTMSPNVRPMPDEGDIL